MTYLSKYKRSAIIGYWRQGTSNEEIAFLVNLPIERIKEIISVYVKDKKLTSTTAASTDYVQCLDSSQGPE